MELSPTTFILEIINFIVLVWILKRLFFLPVKMAIEARRLEIKKSIDEAAGARATAEQLRAQFQDRLKDWEKEKSTKFEELNRDLDLERQRRLQEVALLAKKENERLDLQDQRKREELKSLQEREAISQSLVFLSKFLSNFASQDIESGIIHSFVKALQNDPVAWAEKIRTGDGAVNTPILIHSVFPISEKVRGELIDALNLISKDSPKTKFETDKSLLSGIEVTIGQVVMRANLRDELGYFSQVENNGV